MCSGTMWANYRCREDEAVSDLHRALEVSRELRLVRIRKFEKGLKQDSSVCKLQWETFST